MKRLCINTANTSNEEQIITGYPIDGAMDSSCGGRLAEVIDGFFM